MTYFSRSSSQGELILCTFSVMFSIVRFFIGGILTFEGSMMGEDYCKPSISLTCYENGFYCESKETGVSAIKRYGFQLEDIFIVD
jgi:hypothetical protein